MAAYLQAALEGYVWTPVEDGESGGIIHLLQAPGRPDLYVKHGRGTVATDITDEMARLAWLQTRFPVPAIHHFISTPTEACLVTAAVPGQPAHEYLEQHPARRLDVVRAIAATLRSLHALPIAECPFYSGLDLRLAHAQRRLHAGLVDESDFGPEHQGWSAQQVFDKMLTLLPIDGDLVVTHGDFSLGNILFDGERLSGCIDVGRVGTANPYQDLAILADSLADFGPDLPAELFRAYGIQPDDRKIAFHLCLDEMF